MIYIIDDDIAVRTSMSLLLKQAGYVVKSFEDPKIALAALEGEKPALILLDMNFSVETSGKEGLETLQKIKAIKADIPVILITGWGSVDLAVAGMKVGAADFIQKPWNNAHVVRSVKNLLELSAAPSVGTTRDRQSLDQQFDFGQIVGEDARLMEVLETVGRISRTEASVLIQGESGTGKEMIAEAIHQNSARRHQPFVKVNLGGISASLFESEMFGHKKGAFTDAWQNRTGRFEMADKGTIFLDEIGDLDLNSQVKLLRVLQDRTYEVLGDSQTRSVDVRVICATNRDLAKMVEKQTFREDLFYRINLITLKLPALRQRPGDIPLLVEYFLNSLRTLYGRPGLSISKKALNWLRELPFPGNIRELKKPGGANGTRFQPG